jgi:hypothetical protein
MRKEGGGRRGGGERGRGEELMYIKERYWKSVANRKHVLLDFAARHQFDPLVAANWYKAPLNEIYEVRVFLFKIFY